MLNELLVDDIINGIRTSFIVENHDNTTTMVFINKVTWRKVFWSKVTNGKSENVKSKNAQEIVNFLLSGRDYTVTR